MPLPKIMQPTFDLTLPSSKKTVKIRPMSGRESKILLMAKEGDDKTEILSAVKQIVYNCIVTPINLEDLTIFDLEFSFLRIHMISVSNVTKVAYRDHEDDKVYDFEIDLSKVGIKYPENSGTTMSVTPEIDLELRYPKSTIYTNKDFLNLTSEKEIYDFLLRHCIILVRTKDNLHRFDQFPKEEQDAFIDDLPAKVFTDIMTFIDNLPHLEYTIEYKNSKGTERKIILRALSDFFTFA